MTILDNLTSGITGELKNYPVVVEQHHNCIGIMNDAIELCRLEVLSECYKISTEVENWNENTSYLCITEEGACVYYVDTIDECIGETMRLVHHALQQNKTTPLERERILDAADKLSFSSIFEAINDAVGTNYTGWMKATWPNNEGNGVFRLWFPKLAQFKNGKPVIQSHKCVNSISDDWNVFTYDDLNERGRDPIQRNDFYDLIFAKEPNGKYIFRGVYRVDKENSVPNHYIERRVASRVKLIGNPANSLVLLDSIEEAEVTGRQ